jgi:hypothetical protein
VNISDLNYLHTVDETVEGGYYFGDPVNTTIRENLDIRKYFDGQTYVRNNFAGSEGTALASGPSTSTQSITASNAVYRVGSASQSTSVSAAAGF